MHKTKFIQIACDKGVINALDTEGRVWTLINPIFLGAEHAGTNDTGYTEPYWLQLTDQRGKPTNE